MSHISLATSLWAKFQEMLKEDLYAFSANLCLFFRLKKSSANFNSIVKKFGNCNSYEYDTSTEEKERNGFFVSLLF